MELMEETVISSQTEDVTAEDAGQITESMEQQEVNTEAKPEESEGKSEEEKPEEMTLEEKPEHTLLDMRQITASSFIGEAIEKMDLIEEEKKEKLRLQGEVKQSDKAITAMEKAIADTINTELREKKELLAGGYDEQIGILQNQIKECKSERSKAKADAVAERIQRENMPFEQENTELKQQIEQSYAENNILPIFKKHWLVVLFFPAQMQDWLCVGTALALAFFLVPLIFVAMLGSHPIAFSFILCLYISGVFASYVYVLHKYMLGHQHVHRQIEQLKARIRTNTKKMNIASSNIRKSQDETGYHLGSFDDRIAILESEVKNVLTKRELALEEFERTTRHEISQRVLQENQEEKNRLMKKRVDNQTLLDQSGERLESLENSLKTEYEPRIGKELMHRQKLMNLNSFCLENSELSLEAAIDCYKSTRK